MQVAVDFRNGVITMMQCVTVVTFIVTSNDVTVVTFSNVAAVTFAAHNQHKPNYVYHTYSYILYIPHAKYVSTLHCCAWMLGKIGKLQSM